MLADFDLACRYNQTSQIEYRDSAGTEYSAAPEVFAGVYGPMCDIWSCGIALLVMLTAQLPFTQATDRCARFATYKKTSRLHSVSVFCEALNRVPSYVTRLLEEGALQIDDSSRWSCERILQFMGTNQVNDQDTKSPRSDADHDAPRTPCHGTVTLKCVSDTSASNKTSKSRPQVTPRVLLRTLDISIESNCLLNTIAVRDKKRRGCDLDETCIAKRAKHL